MAGVLHTTLLLAAAVIIVLNLWHTVILVHGQDFIRGPILASLTLWFVLCMSLVHVHSSRLHEYLLNYFSH